MTGSESYLYNNANMLLTRNGQSYSNDANGNTLLGGGRSMVWDSQNRMAQCIAGTGNSQKTSSFTYGSDGLRRRMTVVSANGNPTYTTDYVLDGQNVVQELTTVSGNVNPVVAATYLMGPSGPLYKRPANSADVRWYLYDGGGNVTGEVDPLGNVTASEKHDVFGAMRGGSGSAISKHGWQGGVGHQSDGETGLVYMRARYYAPELGRFQSEDPAKDGANWFSYCKNNPVNYSDISGKEPLDVLSYIYELFQRWQLGYVAGPLAIEFMKGMQKLLGRIVTEAELAAAEDEVRAILDAEAGACHGEGATFDMQFSRMDSALAAKNMSTAAVCKLTARMIDAMIEIISQGSILD